MGSNTIKIKDNNYETTDEKHKALSSTGKCGKIMKKGSDFLMLYNIKIVIAYKGAQDRFSKCKIFHLTDLPEKVAQKQSRFMNEKQSVGSQGEAVEIIIPSNFIDNWTRSEVLLGLKLCDYTDTPTEASNIRDELIRRGEIQNEKQYRKSLDQFHTK